MQLLLLAVAAALLLWNRAIATPDIVVNVTDDGTCTACGCSGGGTTCPCCSNLTTGTTGVNADVVTLSGSYPPEFGSPDGTYFLPSGVAGDTNPCSFGQQFPDIGLLIVFDLPFGGTSCSDTTLIWSFGLGGACEVGVTAEAPFGACDCDPLSIVYRFTVSITVSGAPGAPCTPFGVTPGTYTAQVEVTISP